MSKWILPAFFAILLCVLMDRFVVTTPSARAADAPATQPAVDPKPVNTKCPVTGEDIDPKVTTVYDGKTIAFCCEDCVKAFKKNPDKYIENVK